MIRVAFYTFSCQLLMNIYRLTYGGKSIAVIRSLVWHREVILGAGLEWAYALLCGRNIPSNTQELLAGMC